MYVVEDKCSFIFTIQNYSSFINKNKEYLESPKYAMNKNKDMKWCLKLYPNGINAESTDYVSLYLKKAFDIPSTVKATFFISVLDKNGKHFEMRASQSFNNNDVTDYSAWGEHKFIENKELFKRKDTLLPYDTLTIFCSIIVNVSPITELKIVEIKKITEDSKDNEIIKLDTKFESDVYEKFFADDSFSDITLTVDDKELKAHKGLLAAASPVFASFFKKDKNVAETNSIIVTDISYEVMKVLLYFIYTKKVDDLHNIAHELIVAADKYGIQDLKNKCEESLCNSISIDNVLKIIVIADENNADKLKKLAAESILKNKKALNSNSDFKSIFKTRLHLYELLFWSDIESAV